MSRFSLPKLTPNNYQSWSSIISCYLVEEGVSSSGDNDSKVNAKGLRIIRSSVSAEVLPHIQQILTVKDTWAFIMNKYGAVNKDMRFRKLLKLFSSKKRKGEAVKVYISRLKSLCNEVNCLKEENGIPVLSEEFLVCAIVQGLPEKMRLEVLKWSVDDLTVENLELKLDLQENLFTEPDDGVFSAQKKGRKDKSKVKCFKCKKFGHFAKECKVKNGVSNLGILSIGDNLTSTNGHRQSHCDSALDSPILEATRLMTDEFCHATSIPNRVVVSPRQSNLSGTTGISPSSNVVNMIDNQEDIWVVDSGCSKHITGDKSKLLEIQKVDFNQEFVLPNLMVVKSNLKGKVILNDVNNGEIFIDDVWYVPELKKNLLSVAMLLKQGFKIDFRRKKCDIFKDKNIVFEGIERAGMFILVQNGVNLVDSSQIIHERFGHLSRNGLNKIGFKCRSFKNCKGCREGEHPRASYNKGLPEVKTSRVLQLVHSDLCGPMQIDSLGGAKYVVTFIDDFTRFSKVYFIRYKSEMIDCFIEFKRKIENFTGEKISKIKSDGGGEYTSKEFEVLLKKKGIEHIITTPYAHQQNGIAERLNRTLMVKARSMLFQNNLPLGLWAEAVATANFVRNYSVCSTVGISPFEKLYGKKPDFSILRIFGCIAWVRIPKEKRKKLDKQSKELVFIGYSPEKQGYKLYDPKLNKVVYSRDVIFDETRFFSQNIENSEKILFFTEEKNDDNSSKEEKISDDYVDCNREETSISIDDEKLDTWKRPKDLKSKKALISEMEKWEIPVLKKDNADDLRGRYETEYNKQYTSSSRKSGTNCVSLVPKNYEEAINSQEKAKWKKAMDCEIESMKKNKVWKLVNFADGKLISTKWVFDIKRGANGEVLRYKARLVARGFSQKFGVDYNETFAPVVRAESLRIALVFGLYKKWCFRQIDIKTAFLNGKLEEKVYIKQPPGFDDNTGRVCLLRKALYGLKQAPRCWNKRLVDFLEKLNFRSFVSDVCVLKRDNLIIVVYVDDLIIIGKTENEIDQTITKLKDEFELRDLGNLSFILGVEFTISNDTIRLSQKKFIKEIVNEFGQENAKPVKTPLDSNQKLTKNGGATIDNENLYRRLIGKLNYLAVWTRPDITFAVSQLSRFLSCPETIHWNAAKRIVRYLAASVDLNLVFKANNLEISGYSDADWAGCIDTRKSTSGYVVFIGDCLVSWKSKIQPTVALSSMEAEYYALSLLVQELLWIQGFAKEFGFSDVVTVHEDNQACISFAKNSNFHGRAKHVSIRYNFVKDFVNRDSTKLVYCASESMRADLFTKALSLKKFEKLRSLIGFRETWRSIEKKESLPKTH